MTKFLFFISFFLCNIGSTGVLASRQTLPYQPARVVLGEARRTKNNARVHNSSPPFNNKEAIILSRGGGEGGRYLNFVERVGAAIALLGGSFLLVQYTGKNGLIALVFFLQWSMFYETCKLVEDHYQATSGVKTLKRGKSAIMPKIPDLHIITYVINTEPFATQNAYYTVTFQKWWWFCTIVLATSVRSLLIHSNGMELLYGIDPHFIDFVAYGMTAVGLVNGVVGMAIHRAAGPDMFRVHLAKMAAYHFALVRAYDFFFLQCCLLHCCSPRSTQTLKYEIYNSYI